MNEAQALVEQTKLIDAAFANVLAGSIDADRVQAAASIYNAKTRRLDLNFKRAVKGGYATKAAPAWMAEDPCTATSAA